MHIDETEPIQKGNRLWTASEAERSCLSSLRLNKIGQQPHAAQRQRAVKFYLNVFSLWPRVCACDSHSVLALGTLAVATFFLLLSMGRPLAVQQSQRFMIHANYATNRCGSSVLGSGQFIKWPFFLHPIYDYYCFSFQCLGSFKAFSAANPNADRVCVHLHMV